MFRKKSYLCTRYDLPRFPFEQRTRGGLRVFKPNVMNTFNEDSEKIPYEKSPISIEEQVQKLKSRGLIIDDEVLASKYLTNISYYRLRAYTYPFQDNSDPETSRIPEEGH